MLTSTSTREDAEWHAASENGADNQFRCTVVRRTVTYGEWEPVQ